MRVINISTSALIPLQHTTTHCNTLKWNKCLGTPIGRLHSFGVEGSHWQTLWAPIGRLYYPWAAIGRLYWLSLADSILVLAPIGRIYSSFGSHWQTLLPVAPIGRLHFFICRLYSSIGSHWQTSFLHLQTLFLFWLPLADSIPRCSHWQTLLAPIGRLYSFIDRLYS